MKVTDRLGRWSGSLAIGASIAIAAAALGGCQAADEAGDPGDGLSVVELDEAAGKLVLDYQREGRSIRYDMRLGPPMETPPSPEELAANPELPTHDVDVRVLDADGRPILLQMAGHSFLDATWAQVPVEGFDERGRLMDFGLMRQAVAEFRALELPPGLEQLRRTGVQVGLATAAEHAKPELAGSRPPERGTIAWGPSSVVKWDFVVRKKPFGCCGVGDHSAVELRGWSSSSSVVYRAYSCNHGTCASDTSVMSTHCVMSGWRADDGTHSRYFYSDGCTTSYNVTSVGGHNCNDDSELQGRAIWYDSPQSTTGGSCNSLGPHNWAPGCSY
jgi:hypothetical protein